MVLFAPGGIASLITVHGQAMRVGLLKRLAPGYMASGLAFLVLFAGLIALVELTYQLGEASELSKPFKLFWLVLEPSKWTSWALAGVVFAIGLGLFLTSLRPVRAAWQAVNAELQARGAA